MDLHERYIPDLGQHGLVANHKFTFYSSDDGNSKAWSLSWSSEVPCTHKLSSTVEDINLDNPFRGSYSAAVSNAEYQKGRITYENAGNK